MSVKYLQFEITQRVKVSQEELGPSPCYTTGNYQNITLC